MQKAKQTKSKWRGMIVVVRDLFNNIIIFFFIFWAKHIIIDKHGHFTRLISKSCIIVIIRNKRVRSVSSSRLRSEHLDNPFTHCLPIVEDVVMISCKTFTLWIKYLRMWLITKEEQHLSFFLQTKISFNNRSNIG